MNSFLKNHSGVTDGQLDSCSLNQQPRGDWITAHINSQVTLARGSGEGQNALSSTHVEHRDRLRIQHGEGQIGLDVGTGGVPKINQILGPLDVDLFASRLTHQLPWFFSWRQTLRE